MHLLVKTKPSYPPTVLLEDMLPQVGTNQLLFKFVFTLLIFVGIVYVAPLTGPYFTFFTLDLLLSVYLYSLFRGRWRILFLVHPIFVFLSSLGFQIPFADIGVGFTYILTFENFVDQQTLAVNWSDLFFATFLSQAGFLGFAKVYIGTIPILWFPKYLFQNAPDITLYYSLSLWTLFCTAIMVNVALVLRVIRAELLLIMALYMTVSPTFFDINTTLHRYTLMILGLSLFLITYIGLTRKAYQGRMLLFIFLMIVSIVLIGVSKAPLFLSLALFFFLDLWFHGKVPILSSFFNSMNNKLRILIVVALIILFQLLANLIVPENFVLHTSQQGGQYPALNNIPIIGLIMRVIYAALSPFPWINFSQWYLYGNNTMFLGVHILSAILTSWIILSLFSRISNITNGSDDIRTCAIFGVAIMSSLAFSEIGYHVYLAPAMPFLATLLYVRSNRIHYIYPIGFVFFMEFVAQLARLVR